MRIYDSFPFDGELDLLEHRLRETYDEIDVFVLVEAGETYRGDSKPLVFDMHRERFGWAREKLRYVKLASLGGPSLNPRARAAIQRDASMMAMRDLRIGDVVLLLDVDEVPNKDVLRRLRAKPPQVPSRLLMTRHYQYLDMIGPASACCPDRAEPFAFAMSRLRAGAWHELSALWYGRSGVVVPAASLLGEPFAGLQPATPFRLRFGASHHALIPNAGRHLSSVDPSTCLDRKLSRVFHAEWATERAMSAVHLHRCREHGVHHRGWWYAEAPRGPLPEDLERLVERCAALAKTSPMPPLWRRRAVRTWSWLRLWRGWPEGMVKRIDRRFAELLPILIGPLELAEMGRRLCAGLLRRQSVITARAESHHG